MSQPIPKQEIAPPLTVNAQTGVTFGIGPRNFRPPYCPTLARWKIKMQQKCSCYICSLSRQHQTAA